MLAPPPTPKFPSFKALLSLPRENRLSHRRSTTDLTPSKSEKLTDTFTPNKRFWRSPQSLSMPDEPCPIPEKEAKEMSSSLFTHSVYCSHFVDTESLCDLLNQMKNGDPYNIALVGQFVTKWHKELDRLASFTRKAAKGLSDDITPHNQNLYMMVSPITHTQKTTLYVIREFLAQYRTDLEDEYHFAPERSTEENVEPWRKEYMPVQALAHVEFHLRMRRRDMAFAECFAGLKERTIVAVKKLSQKHCRSFLFNVLRFERELYLYITLVDTQFQFLHELWDAMNVTMRGALSAVDLRDFEAFVQDFEEKKTEAVEKGQKFLKDIKTILTDSTPSFEDFTCSICLGLYYEPTLLPACPHKFCRRCIDQLPTHSPKMCSTPDLPSASERPEPYKSCPLCRTPFCVLECIEDTAMANFIGLYFPKETQGLRRERSAEVNKEKFKKWIKGTARAGAPGLLLMAGAPIYMTTALHDESSGARQREERVPPSGLEMMAYVAWL
ncbi:hypothetical protein BC937DRAFT_87749 [Endogone sp. FLAS-F59071]|nr:hypothetical protein BC937DRAFT_87749 [Endogone sp. FLAS-F59071]|eukprot:RUS19268.1 hypothetical protein BC937DRAFT_87749 [Endogone sp. FLAS-F59071]